MGEDVTDLSQRQSDKLQAVLNHYRRDLDDDLVKSFELASATGRYASLS